MQDFPALTVIDLEILSEIMRSGGMVMVSKSPGHDHEAHTLDGQKIPVFRLKRLLLNKKLVAMDDGLWPGHTQTYRAETV